MTTFAVVAKDREGRDVREQVEAETLDMLLDRLRQRELVVLGVQKKEVKKGWRLSFSGSGGIKPQDVVMFARQLSTLVDAGIPIVQSLSILSEQTQGQFHRVLDQMKRQVEEGRSLSQVMRQHPKVFSTLFVSMVHAGEVAGALQTVLERMAGYMERTLALNRKVKAAMIYPSVVSGMAVLITLLLLIKVIPVFEEIYESFGGELPLPTQILLNISALVRQYFLFLLIFLAVSAAALWRWIRTPAGREVWDRMILRLPVFGPLFRKVAISRFSRTLATLFQTGVPVLVSLEIVQEVAGNRVVAHAVEKVRDQVRQGQPMAEPLLASGVFPAMVVRMIEVGEKTGQIEKMLAKIADFYDEQVEAAIAGLTSIIEPVLIAFLGVVVGGIVICMFMPIFKLSEVVSKF